MVRYFNMLRAACVVAMLVIGAQAAHAACSCGGVQNIVEHAQNNINAHTTDIGNQITQTILKGIAQLSAYQDRAISANERVQNAAQMADAIRDRQKARAAAEGGRYDPAASACVDLSGIFSMGKSGQNVSGYSGNDIVNESRNWSYGNGDVGKPVDEGGLAVANAIIQDRDQLKNVGGFADPTSDMRLLTNAETLDTSNAKIAKALVRLNNNVVDPVPPKPVTTEEAKTPAGRAQIAAREVDAARRSAASAILGYLGDIAAPTGGSALASWAKKAAPQNYPYTIGDKVSELQAMDIFVRSRFDNPDWQQKLAGMSPSAVQREQLLTTALNVQINWMRFALQRRQAAALAALLSTTQDLRDSRTTSTAPHFGG